VHLPLHLQPTEFHHQQGYRNRHNLINREKKYFYVLRKKVSDQTAATIWTRQLSIQFIGKGLVILSGPPKSGTFVYSTKVTTATWYINNIIPVYISLVIRDD
jgi:hypothetical protein